MKCMLQAFARKFKVSKIKSVQTESFNRHGMCGGTGLLYPFCKGKDRRKWTKAASGKGFTKAQTNTMLAEWAWWRISTIVQATPL